MQDILAHWGEVVQLKNELNEVQPTISQLEVQVEVKITPVLIEVCKGTIEGEFGTNDAITWTHDGVHTNL